jgi:hypothetical protein
MFKRIVVLALGMASYGMAVQAQTIPVGAAGTEDVLRSLQLMGKIDPTVSFTARPFFTSDRFTTDSLYALIDPADAAASSYKSRYTFGKTGVVEALPVTWIQQYNSHHPYGWNNAGMISAKGYQTLVSAGVYAKLGPLSVQLRPEFVYAANPVFAHNAAYGMSTTTGSYTKLFPGQSNIRLNAGPVSLGISTENLWWGPGVNNALLMTNNAPGFAHITLNSTRPVKTPVGHFEWQLVSGKLEWDPGHVAENMDMRTYEQVYFPTAIENDWRYFNGIVISYQPKWTPGLTLGLTRAFQTYHEDLSLNRSFMSKYLPVFSAFQKDQTNNEDSLRRDQVTSLFFRWAMPSEQFELYGEYGWNDHSANTRDFVMSPTHSAAYLAGVRKLFPLKNNRYIETNIEIIQLSQSPDYLVREAGNWYVHGQILQGYTNHNQVLGAGIGPGRNMQTATVSWVNGWKRLGIMLERLQNDPIVHAIKWTDISLGLLGQWNYRHFLFNARLQCINSQHYAWEPPNKFNVHGIVSASYRF